MWSNYIKESTLRLIYSMLLLAGGLLIGYSIILSQSLKPEVPFYQSTPGTVLASQQVRPGQYSIQVRFSLPNGASVTGDSVLPSNKAPEPGSRVLVQYNPYTPDEFSVRRLPHLSYQVVIFLGILVGGIGFRLFIKTIFRNAKISFIRENGKKIVPSDVRLVEKELKVLRFLRLKVLFIQCSWQNPKDETQLQFTSEPYPLKLHDRLNLHSVRVYFIPQDPRRYYIQVNTSFDSHR